MRKCDKLAWLLEKFESGLKFLINSIVSLRVRVYFRLCRAYVVRYGHSHHPCILIDSESRSRKIWSLQNRIAAKDFVGIIFHRRHCISNYTLKNAGHTYFIDICRILPLLKVAPTKEKNNYWWTWKLQARAVLVMEEGTCG